MLKNVESTNSSYGSKACATLNVLVWERSPRSLTGQPPRFTLKSTITTKAYRRWATALSVAGSRENMTLKKQVIDP
jgi:hypothetical protein